MTGVAGLAGVLLVIPGPTPATAMSYEARHIATTLLSQLDPPSPDPAGITYLPDIDRLLIGDSEVNEMTLFSGVNLFELRRDRELTATGDTLPWSDEPTGLSYDAATGRLFVSDDRSTGSFHVVEAGDDGRFGTPDDFSRRIAFNTFGLFVDAEGIAFDPLSGDVFVTDGGQSRSLWRVSPGANGSFEGGTPVGDDTVTRIDLSSHGIQDAEGVAFNPFSGTLLVADRRLDVVFEVTRGGELVRTIDIGAVQPLNPAGLVLAPASVGDGWNLFVVDRGVDNDVDPDENDGRLFEFAVDFGPTIDGAAAACSGAPPSGFSDASGTHGPAIDCIAWWDVARGFPDGSYRPGAAIRRDQMATFFATVLAVTGVALPPDARDAFTDDDGNVHEGSIDVLAALGVVGGASEGVYDPAANVTRGQMATFLAATWRARVGEELPAAGDMFADDDGSVHETNINRVASAGLTSGTATGSFAADDDVTRGQMATFVARLLARLTEAGHAIPPGA